MIASLQLGTDTGATPAKAGPGERLAAGHAGDPAAGECAGSGPLAHEAPTASFRTRWQALFAAAGAGDRTAPPLAAEGPEVLAGGVEGKGTGREVQAMAAVWDARRHRAPISEAATTTSGDPPQRGFDAPLSAASPHSGWKSVRRTAPAGKMDEKGQKVAPLPDASLLLPMPASVPAELAAPAATKPLAENQAAGGNLSEAMATDPARAARMARSGIENDHAGSEPLQAPARQASGAATAEPPDGAASPGQPNPIPVQDTNLLEAVRARSSAAEGEAIPPTRHPAWPAGPVPPQESRLVSSAEVPPGQDRAEAEALHRREAEGSVARGGRHAVAAEVDASGGPRMAIMPAAGEVTAMPAHAPVAGQGVDPPPHPLSPGVELSPRAAFTALDGSLSTTGPTWLHAGAQRAEAGFQDPALGWIGVRADVGPGGVHAAIVPGSAEAAQALGGHLEGLHAHLAAQQISVHSLSLLAFDGGAATGSAQGDAPHSGQGGQQEPALAGKLYDRPAGPPARREEVVLAAIQPAITGQGTYVSVMA